MNETSEAMPVLFIEKMHGFDRAVAELMLQEMQVIYTDLPTIIEESTRQNGVIGIIKGPRTILKKQELERMVQRHPDLILSYIGRHPRNILAPDVHSSSISQVETILFAHTEHGSTPVLSLTNSPLSSAVCAYTVTLSKDLLQGQFGRAKQLCMHGGNTFTGRIGHSFTENSLRGWSCAHTYSVAVIGAGDIGSRVIRSYAQAGAEVRYTATRANSSLPKAISFIPSTTQLLQCRSRIDLLTIHVPSGVLIPLERIPEVGVFINTSSGSNIDEDELIRALEERRIHTALIDVFRLEGKSFSGTIDPFSNRFIQSKLNPYPHCLDTPSDTQRKYRLQNFIEEKRLFLTPHIGYREEGVARKALALALESILDYHKIMAPA